MSTLNISYEPKPIPWRIYQEQGKQTKPSSAYVSLTVYAVDADSGEPVTGDVSCLNATDPAYQIDDPNHFSFKTNTPYSVELQEVTDRGESPYRGQPLFFAPQAQVTAEGYESVVLDLM